MFLGLRNFFNRRVELTRYESAEGGITNLIISEQTCGNSLSLFLKEGFPLILTELINLAEGYVLVHCGLHANVNSSVVPKDDIVGETPEGTKLPKKNINRAHMKYFTSSKAFVSNVENLKPKRNNKDNGNIEKVAMCAHSELLECGHVVEVVSCLANIPVSKSVICQDIEVQFLRDTGCSTVVVKTDLEPDNCLTGKKLPSVKFADGQVQSHLIIGNIPP